MKSAIKQLESRGYATDESLLEFRRLNDLELKKLLKDENAVKRTIAAKIFGERKEAESLPLLCEALKSETKLYTKIAICDAIENFGTSALIYLIPLIGKIGNNQQKKADLVDINKKSFPLPRDIATRIIIRIGSDALPFLKDIIENGEYEQLIEAIDAIGHITYNYSDYRSEKVLINLFKNSIDELTKWKIIRAFQSFNSKEIELMLEEIIKNSNNRVFREEAKRSLSRIRKKAKLTYNLNNKGMI